MPPICNEITGTALDQATLDACMLLDPHFSFEVQCDKIFVTWDGGGTPTDTLYELYQWKQVGLNWERQFVESFKNSLDGVFQCVPEGTWDIMLTACVGGTITGGGCGCGGVAQSTPGSCCKSYDACNCLCVCSIPISINLQSVCTVPGTATLTVTDITNPLLPLPVTVIGTTFTGDLAKKYHIVLNASPSIAPTITISSMTPANEGIISNISAPGNILELDYTTDANPVPVTLTATGGCQPIANLDLSAGICNFTAGTTIAITKIPAPILPGPILSAPCTPAANTCRAFELAPSSQYIIVITSPINTVSPTLPVITVGNGTITSYTAVNNVLTINYMSAAVPVDVTISTTNGCVTIAAYCENYDYSLLDPLDKTLDIAYFRGYGASNGIALQAMKEIGNSSGFIGGVDVPSLGLTVPFIGPKVRYMIRLDGVYYSSLSGSVTSPGDINIIPGFSYAGTPTASGGVIGNPYSALIGTYCIKQFRTNVFVDSIVATGWNGDPIPTSSIQATTVNVLAATSSPYCLSDIPSVTLYNPPISPSTPALTNHPIDWAAGVAFTANIDFEQGTINGTGKAILKETFIIYNRITGKWNTFSGFLLFGNTTPAFTYTNTVGVDKFVVAACAGGITI